MSGFQEILVIGDERMKQLGKHDKVPVDILPDIMRDVVIQEDIYTVDEAGFVYDPYGEKYPDIETIIDEYEYWINDN